MLKFETLPAELYLGRMQIVFFLSLEDLGLSRLYFGSSKKPWSL